MSKFAGGTAAALAVAFLLCAGAVFFSEDTDAETKYTDDSGVVYILGDTTAAVSGYNAAKLPSDGKIVIPASIAVDSKDYPVTAIKYSAFENCTALTSVVIPDSVVYVGSSAFSECTSLTSVIVPDSVTSIGRNAFSDCTSLTSVTIGEKVASMGPGVFYDCDKLTSISLPASLVEYDASLCACASLTTITVAEGNTAFTVVDNLLYSKDMKTLYQCPGGLTAATISGSAVTIANGAFEGCASLISVTIPDSVTTLDTYAFYDCTALTSVTIGEKVETIGYDAFYGCTALTSVTIGEKVETIGGEAFYGCTALTSVNIPASVTACETAFGWCTALTAFTVADGNQNYCAVDGVLYSKDMKTLVQCPGSFTAVAIPASVTAIAEEAFDSCLLTALVIPDSVTGIGDYAFYECTALTAVYIGSGIVDFDSGVFGYYFCDADGKELADTAVPGHCYQLGKVGTKDSYILYDGSLVAAAATAGGNVTGGGLYAAGADVTLTATAADGYSFAGWYSGETKVSEDAAYTFKLAGSVTYTAEFSKNAEPSGGSNTWIWIVVIVVVILVVLLAVYFLFIRTGKLKL